ncbi:MAG: PC4/YdbC family ssDNA-binding protein [Eubacteriaceae bacterium]|nr:PC4/YdbC family ssDNA-binding protein [Eubacteriaceae bacterium]
MAVNENEKKEIKYDIKEHIGVIKTFNTGWQKELNLISWNDGTPKYDIREWDMKHAHMTRGITLFPDEMESICSLLQGREFETEEN